MIKFNISKVLANYNKLVMKYDMHTCLLLHIYFLHSFKAKCNGIKLVLPSYYLTDFPPMDNGNELRSVERQHGILAAGVDVIQLGILRR